MEALQFWASPGICEPGARTTSRRSCGGGSRAISTNVLLMAAAQGAAAALCFGGRVFPRHPASSGTTPPVLAHQDTFPYRASKFIRRPQGDEACRFAIFILTVAGWDIDYAASGGGFARAGSAPRQNGRFKRCASGSRNAMMFDVHDSIKDLPGADRSARKLLVDRALQYLDSLSREVTDDPSLQKETGDGV